MSLWESGEIITKDKLNLKTVYIGSSPPPNPVNGMVWVDVSSTPYLVKVYRSGSWDIARGADVDRVTAPPAGSSDYQTPTAASASSELAHEYAQSTVGNQGVNHNTWYAHLKAAFYTLGRVWVVYSPSSGAGNLNVASSADLANWTVTTVDTVYYQTLWDSWFDGTYLHICYVWYDNSSTYYLRYRRCTPNSNGSLTVGAYYSIFGYTSYSFARPPRICVDDQGYAWVVVRAEAGFPYGAGVYVFKNARNDGSWETASGYPMALWTAVNAPYAAIGSAGSGGKMVAVCGNYDQTPQRLFARFFNGSSWEDSVYLANIYAADYWFTTPILGPDGLVHLLFRAYSPANVHHITFNPSTKAWSTPTDLGFAGDKSFSLFRDHRGILAAYITGTNTLNIRRYVDGIWLPAVQYTMPQSAYQNQNLHQASPGEKAAFLWVYLSTAPYPLYAATFKQMYPARDSIDEAPSTGWRPSTPHGSYITFDLGSVLAGVAGCRILWPDDATLRPQAYRIQASEDNTNWATVASYSEDPGAGWREYAWPPLNRCRYIRVAVDTPGSSGVMIREFDYYQSSIWRHGHRGD